MMKHETGNGNRFRGGTLHLHGQTNLFRAA
jgi:hypothetical protein